MAAVIICSGFGTQENKICHRFHFSLLCLVAQTVKNLPAMQETWVLSLRQEDPLDKGIATYSSILARRIPWTEEPGGL